MELKDQGYYWVEASGIDPENPIMIAQWLAKANGFPSGCWWIGEEAFVPSAARMVCYIQPPQMEQTPDLRQYDRVFDEADPRHIGKIEQVHSDGYSIVSWIERPNIISLIQNEKLRRVPMDVEGARERIEPRLVVELAMGTKPGGWYADELKHFMEPGGSFDEQSNAWNLMVAEIAKSNGLGRH